MLQRLTKGPNNWSLSEVVHAIVLLSHFHSLSSFVFSCGLTQELDPISSQKYNKRKDSGNSSPPSRFGFGYRSNSNSSILGELLEIFRIGNGNFNNSMLNSTVHSGQSKQEVSVDALMQRMRNLSQKQNECSETELNDRFKTVEMQVNKKSHHRLIKCKLAKAIWFNEFLPALLRHTNCPMPSNNRSSKSRKISIISLKIRSSHIKIFRVAVLKMFPALFVCRTIRGTIMASHWSIVCTMMLVICWIWNFVPLTIWPISQWPTKQMWTRRNSGVPFGTIFSAFTVSTFHPNCVQWIWFYSFLHFKCISIPSQRHSTRRLRLWWGESVAREIIENVHQNGLLLPRTHHEKRLWQYFNGTKA